MVIGRRGLLRPSVKKARLPLRRRPPGAIDEASFLARCNGCLDCVTACPQRAIFTLAEWVEPGGGTPVMVPDQRACLVCEDFPCAVACKEDALRVPTPLEVFFGTVELLERHCLPFLGPECGACAGLCPPGVDALELVRGRPQIDQSTCMGCGRCIEACPTTPKSIELVPID